MWSRLATLLLLGLTAVEAQQQCYYAAGQKALDQYIPCGSGSGNSACCLAGDFCLQDGACYSPGTLMTYIAGCTDPTYSDPSCKGGSGTCNKDTQFQGLAMCGNNWVCCGGQGQSGDIPSSDYSHDCPCDAGYGTAIANAGSLPGTESLGTSFPTRPAAASTSSSGSTPSSAAATTTHASSPSNQAAPTSTSNSALPTTFSTFSVPLGNGITGTGSGSAAATSSGAAPAPVSSTPTSTKIGLGVGIPLGVAALAAISVAAFCLRKRLFNSEPQYVTQADQSTPIWVGEAPDSGAPAPQDQGAYNANAGAGGWKANDRSSQMSEVGTPPPQYQNNGSDIHRPQSQGIWQPQRLQAMQ